MIAPQLVSSVIAEPAVSFMASGLLYCPVAAWGWRRCSSRFWGLNRGRWLTEEEDAAGDGSWDDSGHKANATPSTMISPTTPPAIQPLRRRAFCLAVRLAC